MSLKFEGLFNILSLITLRIRNNAVVETKEDNERHTILITSLELALAGSNNEELEDFLGFLYYKNAEGNKVFDADYLVVKEEKNLIEDDFLNNKYKLELDKSVSILLQDWFYNLKEMFYEKDKHNLFFDFLNKSITEKRIPLYKDKGKYQINDDLFTKEDSKAQDVFYGMFNRNGNTLRGIQDNSADYHKTITLKPIIEEHKFVNAIDKIKEFEDGSKAKATQGSKKGGKNRFKDKAIDDLDQSNKQDRIFQANYLKEKLFKVMYQSYLFKSSTLTRRARAEHIYNIILLLKEIKDNAKKESEPFIKAITCFMDNKTRNTNGFPAYLAKTVSEEIKDKKLIYSRITDIIASYFKVKAELIQDSMDYIAEHEDGQYNQFKTFYEDWSREFDNEAKNS